MKRRLLAILLTLVLLIGIIPMSAFSASAKAVDDELAETSFSPDNFKTQIQKVSIGAPITGTDGKVQVIVTDKQWSCNGNAAHIIAKFGSGAWGRRVSYQVD